MTQRNNIHWYNYIKQIIYTLQALHIFAEKNGNEPKVKLILSWRARCH